MFAGNYERQDELLSQKLIKTKVYCFSSAVESHNNFVFSLVLAIELEIHIELEIKNISIGNTG